MPIPLKHTLTPHPTNPKQEKKKEKKGRQKNAESF